MTREHKAWLILKEKVEYSSQFPGTRSQIEKLINMVQEAWEESEVEECSQ